MTNPQTRPAGNAVDVPSVSAERSHWTLVAVAQATFMTYLDNNIINVPGSATPPRSSAGPAECQQTSQHSSVPARMKHDSCETGHDSLLLHESCIQCVIMHQPGAQFLTICDDVA